MIMVSVFFAFFGGRLAKGSHAVADRLYSSERRASAGERFQQQPGADHRAGRGDDGRSNDGHGMPMRHERLERTNQNGDQQRAHKKIGRNHEDTAGFFDTAQIHDGDEQENSKTHRQRVRQERGNRRYQRADSGRDSNGCGEHVIDEQRGCSQ